MDLSLYNDNLRANSVTIIIKVTLGWSVLILLLDQSLWIIVIVVVEIRAVRDANHAHFIVSKVTISHMHIVMTYLFESKRLGRMSQIFSFLRVESSTMKSVRGHVSGLEKYECVSWKVCIKLYIVKVEMCGSYWNGGYWVVLGVVVGFMQWFIRRSNYMAKSWIGEVRGRLGEGKNDEYLPQSHVNLLSEMTV